MRMRETRALWLLTLILLAALLRLLLPGTAETLRAWAEESLAPGVEETVAAWGRALTGQEERVQALHREGGP